MMQNPFITGGTMAPISVVIITYNEERNIREALRSAKDADEIIVVDAFSTDRTVEICREYTDKVYQNEWCGYAGQKQFGINLAKNPWVFVLDADERFTESLWDELSRVSRDDHVYNGYYVSRKNFFLGRLIRHGGWWPDYTLRFFRKDKGSMEERKVHEKVVVDGNTGYLKGHLEHYSYRTISDYLKKMEIYATLSAEELKAKGAHAGIKDMFSHSLCTFIKMFFVRFGFMDGACGFILAALYSYYSFLKYLKLWEALQV
jgi:glycosyltransferase involved in cell wall biosynthesis